MIMYIAVTYGVQVKEEKNTLLCFNTLKGDKNNDSERECEGGNKTIRDMKRYELTCISIA
jgi:hypothetical protein